MTNYPLVSIYTCVYNGERTLHRVFESVKRMDYPNYEHVIVNDGSTDNTDAMIQEYIKEVSYPVKYHKKENGGKHTAYNVVWNIAEGDFLIQLDADDELLPHCARYLVDTYNNIPESIRDQYWCVHGRCVTQHGQFVGDKYPEDINENDWKKALEVASKCSGEKIGLQVRKYLSDYRFPEVVGAHFLPEVIVWREVEKKYGTWYTNEVVRVYYVGEGGNLSEHRTKRKQFGSLTYFYKWVMMHEEDYWKSIKTPILYSLCYFVSDKKYRKHNKYLEGLSKYKFFLVLLYPIMFFGSILFRAMRHIK